MQSTSLKFTQDSSVLVYHFWKHALLLNLDDVTNAHWKKKGLVILDWYFGEGMETNSEGEKVKKERNDKIFFKNCMYTQ